MRSGALKFDETLPDGHIACSTYLDSVLRSIGLSHTDCTEPPHVAVAKVAVSAVRSVSRDGATAFDVRRQALDPNVTPDWQPRDAAHTLITLPAAASGKSKWFRLLASQFQVLIPLRAGE
jgi:hypothetical protein